MSENYTSKEWLYQKYVVDQLGCPQIAKLVNRHPATILYWLQKHNIKTRLPGHNYNRDVVVKIGERVPVGQRFWQKVIKGDGCWEWQGCKQSHGYGQIRIDHKSKLSHRVSWEMVNGPIPDGLHVLHKCDNPACVRPDHLFLGTHEENMEDRKRKGRTTCGEQYEHAKLTTADVIEIRQLYISGLTQRELSERFGVNRRHISRIVNRQRWSQVKEEVTAS